MRQATCRERWRRGNWWCCTAPLPQPVAPVTVRIGGVAAEVRFAGGAAGQIAGVMQVNVVVPAGLAAGVVPVVLTVGGVPSQPGVTVAVR